MAGTKDACVAGRRIDPEPATILIALAVWGATAGTVGTTIAAINYYKTHKKRLPSEIRADILKRVEVLQQSLKQVREHMAVLRSILARAKFPEGSKLRFGQPAKILPADHKPYLKSSGRILTELRRVNRLTLELEKIASSLADVDQAATRNASGKVTEAFQSILDNKTIEVKGAFEQIDKGFEQVGKMIDALKKSLDAS